MPQTHLTRISKNNVMRIDCSVGSSDMSTILTCLWHIWTEGPTHNNGIKDPPPPSRCSVTGDIDADPSAPNHKNYSEYVKPVLVLICHWLGTHSLLMKAFSSSKCYKVHLCDIQRNCISSFENLHVFHVFMKNDWPLGYLTLCHNKGIDASKLNIFLNRWHVSKQINKNWIIDCFGVLMLHSFLGFP